MSSSTLELLFCCLFGLGFGLLLFWTGLSNFKRKKLIENTPTSNIRSIAMGLVEISGRAVRYGDKIITSPFSKKDCVYYKYLIEEYRKSGKSSRWVTLDQDTKSVCFSVEDDTGMVLVDPKGAETNVSVTFKSEPGFGKEPDPSIKEFLKKKGIEFKGLLGFNRTMRFTEWAIFPWDMLYVLGTADDNPYVEEGKAKSSVQDVMIHRGKSCFFISDKSEKSILSELGKSVYLLTIGGGALAIGCLYFIMMYFNIL
jgi:hypothetical protein